jgi:hypothetical protein
MTTISPADARLNITRTIKNLLIEILSDGTSTPLDADVLLAEELSLELLDVLGLEVVEVHENNTVTVLLSPELS